MLLYKFQTREPKLVYSLSGVVQFKGDQENLAIFNMDIVNKGNKQVNGVICSINVSPAVIKNYKIQADDSLKYSGSLLGSVYKIEIPVLNPHEKIVLGFVITGVSAIPEIPNIALRGEGIMGEKGKIDEKNVAEILIIIPSLIAAYAGLFSILLLKRRFKIFGNSSIFERAVDNEWHLDNQNEVLSYLFGLKGMNDEAEYYLRKAKNCSYWAEADRIASIAVSSQNKDETEKRKQILIDLLDYVVSPAPSDRSQGIIHYDIARIAKKQGDEVEFKKHLSVAQKTIPKLLETRLKLDPIFSKPHESMDT